jgi:hypothetical protein
MPGTSSNYVAFTLKLPSFVHIFISKAKKRRSLLVVLSRIDPDPLARSEASFLYHTIRVRPDPATDRVEPSSGVRWGEPPKSPMIFFLFDYFFEKDSALISISCTSAKNHEIQRSKRMY